MSTMVAGSNDEEKLFDKNTLISYNLVASVYT